MKSLLSVSLSVCLFLRLSLNFVKIGLLVFSDIVHYDSWSWHLVIEGARILDKKFGSPNLGQMDQNQAQNVVFYHFLKFDSLVSHEIA